MSLRDLPPVHRFLSDARIAAFEPLLGRESVKRSISATLETARHVENGSLSFESLAAAALQRLQNLHAQELTGAINATGVLAHTNLGRVPIAAAALSSMQRIASGYSNLEYDLERGERGSRYAHAVGLLREVTGAENALVVNNCAAAVLLILDTYAKRREVIIARGQLVEIGGGFRLPEVLERSGASLVEVGATNKVRLADYERALSSATALLMRVHASNFSMSGFTEDVDPRQLAALGRRAGVPVVEDLGSGAVCDLAQFGLPHERTVQDAMGDGIDLVTFSGDKMLGGPQAGIVLGRDAAIARLRNNPLLRALRVDKLTLAALTETLRMWASPERHREIPLVAMLSRTMEELRARAERYVRDVGHGDVIETAAYAGGGTLPEAALRSIGIAFSPSAGAMRGAEALRRRGVPIVARVERDRLVLDLRTVFPEQDDAVVAALRTL